MKINSIEIFDYGMVPIVNIIKEMECIRTYKIKYHITITLINNFWLLNEYDFDL